MSRLRNWLPRLLLLALALPWLPACTPANPFQAQLADYVTRLARSLDQSPPDIPEPVMTRLPEPRSLQLPAPETQINLLEFLELSQCRLHTVIAEANSSLGKFAVASQALMQELNFLRHVDSCIELLPADDKLRQLLADTKTQKQAALPIYLWRATLGGEEFRDFWKTGQRTHGYPDNADSRTDLALNYLIDSVRRVMAGQRELDREQFHEALATLRNNEGGALIASWQHTALAMQAGNQVIAARQADRPLCYNNMVTPKARIFRTVIVDSFVQQVQPKLAILNRRYYELMPKIETLESLFLDIEPAAYLAWRNQRDQQLTAALASVPDHIHAASPLMAECGFLPSVD